MKVSYVGDTYRKQLETDRPWLASQEPLLLNHVRGEPFDVRYLTSSRKINPRIFWQKVPLSDV